MCYALSWSEKTTAPSSFSEVSLLDLLGLEEGSLPDLTRVTQQLFDPLCFPRSGLDPQPPVGRDYHTPP